jgi:ComF family protein
MNYTNSYFDSFLHLLYPSACAGCGNDAIRSGQVLCFDCVEQLPFTGFHRFRDNPVSKIFTGRLHLHFATSFLYFTKESMMQRLLHGLKYKGRKEIGTYLGKMMGLTLSNNEYLGRVQGLIPLPLFKAREQKRGYNQAEVICRGMAEEMKVPVLTNFIRRKSNTLSQTKKNRAERWENMKSGFTIVDHTQVLNKHFLLVDDVITTGATLEACGSELLKAPGAKLSIASLAYATS